MGVVGLKPQDMESMFGESGLLAGLPGFEPRPQQAVMARKIRDFLSSGGEKTLAIEAPTGVGKSLALLVPALLWAFEGNRRVLFLTAGHALQEQLFSKDLPFLAKALPEPFEYGTLKGRSNYFCLKRGCDLESGGFLSFNDGGAASREISEWARETESGDLSELGLPEGHPALAAISASRDGCLGRFCPFRKECFLQRHYQEARGWRVIVANYHLFFSHLDGGERTFPVPFDVLICDEAHRIAEAARSAATRSASAERLRKALSARSLSDIEKCFRLSGLSTAQLQSGWGKAAATAERVFQNLSLLPREEWIFKSPLVQLSHSLEESMGFLAAETERLIPCLEKECEKEKEEGPSALAEGFAAANRLLEAYGDLDWCLRVLHYPHWATWWDGARIQSAPVMASNAVREAFSSLSGIPVICASATLSAGEGFKFWEKETGMSPEEELVLDSPFDLPSQMSIWVVELGLKVTEDGYDERASRVIEKLCVDNGGRTLVLCSSMRLLRTVSERLKSRSRDFLVLCQGDGPKGELLERFRADATSVLLGCLSFREGIDVPGEGLTQVILDRIPFPHPDDPLVRARRDLEGKESFVESTLPMSRLLLRQAFGRLIRKKTDSGKAVLMDSRAFSRPDWEILRDFEGVPLKRIRLGRVP